MQASHSLTSGFGVTSLNMSDILLPDSLTSLSAVPFLTNDGDVTSRPFVPPVETMASAILSMESVPNMTLTG